MTHGFSVGCDDYRIASTISNSRQVPSIENKAFALVLFYKLFDGFTDLGVLLPFHGDLLLVVDWQVGDSVFDFVGAGEFVQRLDQVQPLEGDVKVGVPKPLAGEVRGIAALLSPPESIIDHGA